MNIRNKHNISNGKSGLLIIFVMAFCLIILALVSCDSKHDILSERLKGSPCNEISYWGNEWQKSKVNRRISIAPLELIDKLHIENEIQGIKERPQPAEPFPKIRDAMKLIEVSIPNTLKKILKERLIGIFLVKGLGSTGYTDTVFDNKGNEKYCFIVLDVEMIKAKKANEWATWKENSAFKSKEKQKYRLNLVIEEEENNTVINAIRYIILHELGHVFGTVTKVHTTWKDRHNKKRKDMDYPFQKLSWKMTHDNKILSRFDDCFHERELLKFYFFRKAKLNNEQIPSTYSKLIECTNFASLYAATNLWDDFAESFVIYFHVVIEKRPWRITIEKEGQRDIDIHACWKENRCNRKKEFMDKWFENPINRLNADAQILVQSNKKPMKFMPYKYLN
jgi:hypothetical protein